MSPMITYFLGLATLPALWFVFVFLLPKPHDHSGWSRYRMVDGVERGVWRWPWWSPAYVEWTFTDRWVFRVTDRLLGLWVREGIGVQIGPYVVATYEIPMSKVVSIKKVGPFLLSKVNPKTDEDPNG